MYKLINFLSRFNPIPTKSIIFLTGSRAKSRFFYKNGSFRPLSITPPAAPLCLEDFESVKCVAIGPFASATLVKCTFKNGEEAMADVDYGMLKSLAEFIVV